MSSFHSAESGPRTVDATEQLGALSLSGAEAAVATGDLTDSDAAWTALLTRLNTLRAREGEQGRQARVLRLLQAAMELAEGE